MEVAVRVAAAGEDVIRGKAGIRPGKVIMEPHGMLDCHGPELRVSDIGPMDGGV